MPEGYSIHVIIPFFKAKSAGKALVILKNTLP
jgi:hypothetical protein